MSLLLFFAGSGYQQRDGGGPQNIVLPRAPNLDLRDEETETVLLVAIIAARTRRYRLTYPHSLTPDLTPL